MDLEANNGDRQEMPRKEVKKVGIYSYKAWKPFSQYFIFLSAGPGMLFSSGITLITTVLVTTSPLHKVSGGWNVMRTIFSLVSQSMPTFVVFVADSTILT